MKKFPRYQRLFLFLGILFITYWLFLCILYGNITFSLVFLLTGLLLICFVAFERYFHVCIWKKLAKSARFFLILCFLIASCIFVGVEARILYDGLSSSSTQGDSILVLGAGLQGDKISTSLQYRLDKAIKVHKKNPDQIIIVSGGQGADETISEALAMKTYLIEQGIPDALILMEGASTNTSENFRFSKALLEQAGYSSHITLITNGFHMHRATYIGEQEGFIVSREPAKGLWTTNPCFYVREFFGVVRAYILGF